MKKSKKYTKYCMLLQISPHRSSKTPKRRSRSPLNAWEIRKYENLLLSLLNHKNLLCVGIMSSSMYPHLNKVELKSWRPKSKERDMTINSQYMKYMTTLSQQNRLSYESQTYMTQMRIWCDYMTMTPYSKRSEHDHGNYVGADMTRSHSRSYPGPKKYDCGYV
jgi:hypothetical protein